MGRTPKTTEAVAADPVATPIVATATDLAPAVPVLLPAPAVIKSRVEMIDTGESGKPKSQKSAKPGTKPVASTVGNEENEENEGSEENAGNEENEETTIWCVRSMIFDTRILVRGSGCPAVPSLPPQCSVTLYALRYAAQQ